MTKPKPDKPFVEGLSIAWLLKEPEQPNLEKTAKELSRTPGWYDHTKEILDDEDGWIYQKLRNNKKGKKLRKFLQQLHGGYSGEDNISFWKPKINDLAFCEAKRWMAVQYQKKQFPKITGVIEDVLKNTPFCCIRLIDASPGFEWVVFPHHKVHDRGVSWEWWESNHRRRNKEEHLERPNCQLRQDIGDAWFNYEDRSRLIRQRVGYFEQLFHMALEKRYSNEFYREGRYGLMPQAKKKLIINGRDYLIGETNGRTFGVIAYPESTITEIVEPGPTPHPIKE
jgi:hypothetical protein